MGSVRKSGKSRTGITYWLFALERETGLEPATLCLGTSASDDRLTIVVKPDNYP